MSNLAKCWARMFIPKRHMVCLCRLFGLAQTAFFVTIGLSALILALVSIHSLTPIQDPLTPLGNLDRLSLLLGVQEQTAVIIFDLDKWSSNVYTYVYQRQLSDKNSFFITAEHRERILPGIFPDISVAVPSNYSTDYLIRRSVHELIEAAGKHLPDERQRRHPHPVEQRRVPILIRFTSDAFSYSSKDFSSFLNVLDQTLSNNTVFHYQRNLSLGTLKTTDRRALQWFSINLLRGTLSQSKNRKLVLSETAVIFNVLEEDLELILAVNGSSSKSLLKSLPYFSSKRVYKLQAYGNLVKLVTLRFPGLGLYAARSAIYTTSAANETDVRSCCVNPITDAFWEYGGRTIRVRGSLKEDFELVRERNGPFAGKKINRPVANFAKCYDTCRDYINSKLTQSPELLMAAVRRRPVFMEGLLLEKCFERGLTLPIRGGVVMMKQFSESLKHACKVPNTEQPFACTDMMFLATLLEKMFKFKSGFLLHSPRNLRGMTGDWPLAASFYIYQNGL